MSKYVFISAALSLQLLSAQSISNTTNTTTTPAPSTPVPTTPAPAVYVLPSLICNTSESIPLFNSTCVTVQSYYPVDTTLCNSIKCDSTSICSYGVCIPNSTASAVCYDACDYSSEICLPLSSNGTSTYTCTNSTIFTTEVPAFQQFARYQAIEIGNALTAAHFDVVDLLYRGGRDGLIDNTNTSIPIGILNFNETHKVVTATDNHLLLIETNQTELSLTISGVTASAAVLQDDISVYIGELSVNTPQAGLILGRGDDVVNVNYMNTADNSTLTITGYSDSGSEIKIWHLTLGAENTLKLSGDIQVNLPFTNIVQPAQYYRAPSSTVLALSNGVTVVSDDIVDLTNSSIYVEPCYIPGKYSGIIGSNSGLQLSNLFNPSIGYHNVPGDILGDPQLSTLYINGTLHAMSKVVQPALQISGTGKLHIGSSTTQSAYTAQYGIIALDSGSNTIINNIGDTTYIADLLSFPSGANMTYSTGSILPTDTDTQIGTMFRLLNLPNGTAMNGDIWIVTSDGHYVPVAGPSSGSKQSNGFTGYTIINYVNGTQNQTVYRVQYVITNDAAYKLNGTLFEGPYNTTSVPQGSNGDSPTTNTDHTSGSTTQYRTSNTALYTTIAATIAALLL